MAAEHGTRSRYVQGCRCPDCTEANRAYQRIYMRGREVWAGRRLRLYLRNDTSEVVRSVLERLRKLT